MSEREWKPGDVAMVTFDNASQHMRDRGQSDVVTMIALRREDDWGLASYGCSIADRIVTDAHPLVVIDPEDREQARSIAQRMDDQFAASGMTSHGTPDEEIVDLVQAAIRSLVVPPKPEEPTGLGAVVLDSQGVEVVHIGDGIWTRNSGPRAEYALVDAVKVLSEGVAK